MGLDLGSGGEGKGFELYAECPYIGLVDPFFVQRGDHMHFVAQVHGGPLARSRAVIDLCRRIQRRMERGEPRIGPPALMVWKDGARRVDILPFWEQGLWR